MKKIIGCILGFLCLVMVACQPANITAVKWDSGISGDKAQVRCEQVDMRDNGDMLEVFKKYDGWKIIYISEYTTSNKLGTHGSVCFERAK